MNLPEGFEEMSPVQQALTVARHELVKLQELVVTNEAVALIDKALVQMDKRTDREILKDCLMDFVSRMASSDLGTKTSAEIAILPEMVRELRGVMF